MTQHITLINPPFPNLSYPIKRKHRRKAYKFALEAIRRDFNHDANYEGICVYLDEYMRLNRHISLGVHSIHAYFPEPMKEKPSHMRNYWWKTDADGYILRVDLLEKFIKQTKKKKK